MIDMGKVSGNSIDRANILHSSGIGRAAHGHTFGATSSETFAARQLTEASRRHIGSYSSANVHNDHRAPIRPFGNSGARADITPVSRPDKPAVAVPKGAFRDSSRHRFDPYAG